MVLRDRAIDLLLFPCNGNAFEALDCLGSSYRVVGFIDDATDRNECAGYPVFRRSAFKRYPDAMVLAVPGSPANYRRRMEAIRGLEIPQERFATVIHPGAHVSPRATLGINVLIMAGVVVTSNAIVGNHVCILPNSVIHHDCTVSEGTLLGANVTVAGSVHIGRSCYVASGTSIKNGIRIGDEALVGLGSTVIRDVPAGAVAAGAPARLLRSSQTSLITTEAVRLS